MKLKHCFFGDPSATRGRSFPDLNRLSENGKKIVKGRQPVSFVVSATGRIEVRSPHLPIEASTLADAPLSVARILLPLLSLPEVYDITAQAQCYLSAASAGQQKIISVKVFFAVRGKASEATEGSCISSLLAEDDVFFIQIAKNGQGKVVEEEVRTRQPGVFKITNTTTGKAYIGCSFNTELLVRKYLLDMGGCGEKASPVNKGLKTAFQRDGGHNFSVLVFGKTVVGTTQADLEVMREEQIALHKENGFEVYNFIENWTYSSRQPAEKKPAKASAKEEPRKSQGGGDGKDAPPKRVPVHVVEANSINDWLEAPLGQANKMVDLSAGLVGYPWNKEENTPGVYKITNVSSGHVYIGETIHVGERWHQHYFLLAHQDGLHHNHLLQSAFNRCGESDFVCSVICRFEWPKSGSVENRLWELKNLLWDEEARQIKKLKEAGVSLFNLSPGGPSKKTLQEMAKRFKIQSFIDDLEGLRKHKPTRAPSESRPAPAQEPQPASQDCSALPPGINVPPASLTPPTTTQQSSRDGGAVVEVPLRQGDPWRDSLPGPSIYKIENRARMRVYIGRSRATLAQWRRDLSRLTAGYGFASTEMQKDYELFGKDNFWFEVLVDFLDSKSHGEDEFAKEMSMEHARQISIHKEKGYRVYGMDLL